MRFRQVIRYGGVALLVLAGLLHLAAERAPAQTVGMKTYPEKALGGAVGMASGMGFAFRRLPQEQLGFQVTFIGWKVGDEHFLSVGIQPMYAINKSSTNRLYALGGVGYFSTVDENRVNIGVGLGVEFFVMEQIGSSVDLTLTYLDNGDIVPLPQVAFLYYF